MDASTPSSTDPDLDSGAAAVAAGAGAPDAPRNPDVLDLKAGTAGRGESGGGGESGEIVADLSPVARAEEDGSNRNAADDPAAGRTDHDGAVAIVRRLLGSRVDCRLKDGRTVSGRLVCVDRLSNVILADCWEERVVVARDYHPADLHESIIEEALQRRKANDPPSDCPDDPLSCERTVRRQLAQAMIPGPALVSITMDRKAFEMRTQASRLS